MTPSRILTSLLPGLCSSCQSWCELSRWLFLRRHTAIFVFCHFTNTSKSRSPFWGVARGRANRSGRRILSIVDLWTERHCRLLSAVVAGKSDTTMLAFQFWHALHAMFTAGVCVVWENRVASCGDEFHMWGVETCGPFYGACSHLYFQLIAAG